MMMIFWNTLLDYIHTVRTKITFTMCVKCGRTSIELGTMLDRLSRQVHTKLHDEGSELLCTFDSTSIELRTKWHRKLNHLTIYTGF